MKRTTQKYDAIFIDLIDPEPNTLDFFNELFNLSMMHLTDNGGIISNVGSIMPFTISCADILSYSLKDKFEKRLALCIHVPSFMQAWCFLMGGSLKSCKNTVLPETRFFDKDTLEILSKWSKDYSLDIRNFSNYKN